MINPFNRAMGPLLCVAVVSLFVACAKDDVTPVDMEKQAFEDLRTEIRDAVTDPAREAEAIRLVGVLEEDLAELRATIRARKNRVMELNANYETSRADFDAFLAEVETEIQDNRRQVSATRKAFLANMTPEERSAIAKTRTKAINAAIKTIQAI